MISPSLLRPRRLPLFALAVALLAFCLTLSTPSLFRMQELSMGAYMLRGGAVFLAAVVLAPLLGVLVDRARGRRGVQVALALVSAGAIAIAYGAAQGPGAVGAPVVTAMMMTMSAMATLAPVGQDAFLPSVVGRERLVPANAVLCVLPQLVMLVGGAALSWTGLDGPAVGVVIGVPALCAAVAFRGVEAAEEPPPPRAGLWREVVEGVRFTFREPVLRAIALFLVATSLIDGFVGDMTGAARGPLLDADTTGGGLSLAVTASAYGASFLGPLVAVLLYRRLGAYRLAVVALLTSQPFILLLALSGVPGGWLWYTIGDLVPTAGTIVAGIALLSHRQAITPDRLLGRVGGTLIAVTTLSETVGSPLVGLPGEWLADLADDASSPPALLPGLGLATALALAAAVPLLRGRRRGEDETGAADDPAGATPARP
ncbi:MFS transporter [Nonomuraea gerenzanensis]|uniref:Major facilitator superfamily MFS_1 n=2 Tax=Nonomuraea gerenzanensis TaxID=93944 RepID=A0A1M4EQC1_9ACTN|nr:hypothetical protein [Nonomuraea gerenzanensis]UBU12476.1 hypothetical protein LCN96_50780 [Nonomuraea gerenzanensis]SBP01028.1 major facilitator superfamily MFS_1 [Nonomuraea gerenzanensis]